MTQSRTTQFSCELIDDICCEWGPPEYVMTDDGEAWYWRFSGHELPVADNLSELFVAAQQLKPVTLPTIKLTPLATDDSDYVASRAAVPVEPLTGKRIDKDFLANELALSAMSIFIPESNMDPDDPGGRHSFNQAKRRFKEIIDGK